MKILHLENGVKSLLLIAIYYVMSDDFFYEFAIGNSDFINKRLHSKENSKEGVYGKIKTQWGAYLEKISNIQWQWII